MSVDASARGKVLGVELDGDSLHSQFRTATQHVADVCGALQLVQDARAELALLRVSANVSRVVHLLRAAGPDIDVGLLDGFDWNQRLALGSLLGGPLSDCVWDQAVGAADQGGPGLRSARELQLPAFIASRVEAKALVEDLTSSLPQYLRDRLFSHWKESFEAAMTQWTASMPAATAEVARQLVEAGEVESARRSAQLAGLLPRGRPSDAAEFVAHTTASLLSGHDDPEHPDVAQGLQSQLAALAAQPRMERLRATLRQQEDWEGLQLFDDLRHPDTDHRWLLGSHCRRQHSAESQ